MWAFHRLHVIGLQPILVVGMHRRRYGSLPVDVEEKLGVLLYDDDFEIKPF
jgi:hypothetical protein